MQPPVRDENHVLPDIHPEPDPREAEIAERLTRRIRDELEARGGLSFERYMERALYEPGLGYYRNGTEKFGAQGDFITAPELSPVFAEALAAQFAAVLTSLCRPSILEVGAGTGTLAVDLTRALRILDVEPRYWILEPSPELRARQQRCCEAAGVQARWLDTWPEEPFQGVIVANEVLDAFPVTPFVQRAGEARPLDVGWTGREFAWREGSPREDLSRRIESLQRRLGQDFPEGYRSEVSPRLGPWLLRAAAALERGAVYLVDYGLTETEYYHPQRSRGTLICHYRHRAHPNPFVLPGLQDISAWVDFSACARAARAAGLDVAGFTTQGQFLVEAGAGQRLGALRGSAALAAAQALKTLVLPGEMGERFKLMALSRDLALDPPPGRDFRSRL